MKTPPLFLAAILLALASSAYSSAEEAKLGAGNMTPATSPAVDAKPANPAPADTKAPNAKPADAKPAAPGVQRPGLARPSAPGEPFGGLNTERKTIIDPEQRVQMLKQALNLTDEQAAKVKKIFEEANTDAREELKALAQDNSLTPDQKREEMTKFMATAWDEIEDVLTPEQKPRFVELRKRREEAVKQFIKQGGPNALKK